MKRLKMKAFRAGLGLNQEEMSKKLGCSRGKYAGIEAGSRDGNQAFWQNFKNTFNLSGEKMWEIMSREVKNDEQ